MWVHWQFSLPNSFTGLERSACSLFPAIATSMFSFSASTSSSSIACVGLVNSSVGHFASGVACSCSAPICSSEMNTVTFLRAKPEDPTASAAASSASSMVTLVPLLGAAASSTAAVFPLVSSRGCSLDTSVTRARRASSSRLVTSNSTASSSSSSSEAREAEPSAQFVNGVRVPEVLGASLSRFSEVLRLSSPCESTSPAPESF
mmetsp:Transcript_60805/g.144888  ORF Transcript_60805/g.144888 Transcript_60805/m.144888 type:complete len:204 (-) Transcript_60805:1449-2060(-)